MLLDVVELIFLLGRLPFDAKVRAKFSAQMKQVYQYLMSFTGSKTEQQDAVARISTLARDISKGIADHVRDEWKKAQQEGREAEFIGRMTAEGLMLLEGAVALGRGAT